MSVPSAVSVQQVDMSVEAQVLALVRRATVVAERAGARLGVLVNNAAQFVFGDVTEVTEEQWDRVLGTNVKGCAGLTSAMRCCCGLGDPLNPAPHTLRLLSEG